MAPLLADLTAPQSDHFLWHQSARIVQARGDLTQASGGDLAAIPDQPGAQALAAALARSARGGPFRIGGGTEPPLAGVQPMFETLTSGSTGTPRRIWRSQASWTASFAVNARLFGIGPGTGVAVLGRLIHSLALYGALEALHLGASLHLLADVRPDRQRRSIAASGIKVLYTSPAQARLLAEAPGPGLPRLRVILIGGSKLDAVLRAQLADMAPNAALHEFYGAAETSFLTLAAPDDPIASVGRPYPGVLLDIRDAEGGSLPDAATGEIWAQSPYLFQGYSADPGTAVWQDNWLSVGETGCLAGGLLYVLGRKSRMVRIADQSVFPEEIEAFMATLPGIERVAVLPEQDVRRGAVLMAFAMGTKACEAVIIAATRARFGPLKSPRRIVWRSDWPVLASGKTDLQALQRGRT